MRRYLAALAIAAIGLSPAAAKTPPAKEPCGDYGTTIYLEDTPTKAAKKAKEEEKLVMVLHVSGHFEDPKLT